MSILSIIEALMGFLLILFTLGDALVTILSLQGGGPATSYITRKIWRILLVLHRHKPCHRLLSVSGPALMVLIVIFWYGMLYLGWFLVFNSFHNAVLNSTSLASASDLQTLYFTGVTISGLGYGDYIAQHFPWTLYSTLAVSTGTLLTSLGLSYIIAVVPVALEKRQISHQLNALVNDPDDVIEQLDREDNVKFIWDHLFSIQLNGAKFSTKYGAYPVVAYFHATQINSVFSLAYLNSADVLFYIANHPNKSLRPPAPAVETLKNIIASHTQNLKHVIDERDHDEKAHRERFKLPSYLAEIAGDSFYWDEFRDMRQWLVVACLYDGW